MFNSLLSNWTIIRILRLLLGIFIIIQSYQIANYWMMFPGTLFAIMALLNTGCGSKGCSK